ncbi:hypothetical protein EDB83DRAFT_2314655 [Lactarius deliciosus]|nr:hypothetical protein EDB83DRAFT_2314655 [Lactarius deliciosus]
MLGANVDAIPAPPPRSEPIISIDSFWGPHEWILYPQPYCHAFPYLSWISICHPKSSVPFDILTHPVEKTMWRTHGHRSNSHIINADLLDEFTTKWKSIKAALEELLSAMSSQPSLSCVEQPMKVYIRAFKALKRLEEHFKAWHDFIDVFQNLQRCLLELSTFLEWWKDVRTGDTFQSSPCAPTRSAIFEDKHLYADHPLFYSLHHWYYLPLMDDIMVDLETAACGYLKCLDTFRPTKGFKCSLDKMENKKNDEAGRMAKKARMSTASQIPWLETVELRCLTNAGMAPEWFPKTQDVWIHAMNHMTMVDDTDIHQVVLYYLNLYHAFEEVKEMEHIQFPATFEKWWRGQEMYVYMIVEMWDSSGGNTNFKFLRTRRCGEIGFGQRWLQSTALSNIWVLEEIAKQRPLPPLLLMAPTVVQAGSFATFTKPALCLVVSSGPSREPPTWSQRQQQLDGSLYMWQWTLRWSGGIDGSMFDVPATTLFISSWVSKSLGWRLLEYRSVPSLPLSSWHDHQTPLTYHCLGWGCIGELRREALASVHMDIVGLMVLWPELLPLVGNRGYSPSFGGVSLLGGVGPVASRKRGWAGVMWIYMTSYVGWNVSSMRSED